MSDELREFTSQETNPGDPTNLFGTIPLSVFSEMSTDEKLDEIYRTLKSQETAIAGALQQGKEILNQVADNPMLSMFLPGL